mmetsp:Transcript_2196/g.4389  ORF Transcript_2196/g.4389 Transcript_2196/m.4389 type:complete len:201 (+) Transcript_2196:312-914(+)
MAVVGGRFQTQDSHPRAASITRCGSPRYTCSRYGRSISLVGLIGTRSGRFDAGVFVLVGWYTFFFICFVMWLGRGDGCWGRSRRRWLGGEFIMGYFFLVLGLHSRRRRCRMAFVTHSGKIFRNLIFDRMINCFAFFFPGGFCGQVQDNGKQYQASCDHTKDETQIDSISIVVITIIIGWRDIGYPQKVSINRFKEGVTHE